MSSMKMRGLVAAWVLCAPFAVSAQAVGSGAISLTAGGASENFDSLANTGTSNVLPTGWYFYENGGSALDTYAADNGGSNGGNTYSYGATGSSERAFGAIASNSKQPTLGAKITNNTGGVLTELAIQYVGEQWRRGDGLMPDTLAFDYSTTATGLADDTGWTNVLALDLTSPVTSGATGSALDGNLPANQTVVSAILTGISIPNGASFWIRWRDVNINGADDGLAIDNVVFGTPTDVPPTLISSYPANNATDFPANGTLSLSFSEPVTVSGTWFEIQCASSGYRNPSSVDVSGGPTQYFLTPATAFTIGESCELSFDTDLVVDQGASAFPLVDPGTIHFTTVAPPPNVPPAVVGTVPTQGANNFPSAGSLKVTFSEPVNAASGAFTLTCATSTGISLTPSTSDGGVNFSIDTGTALAIGDTCTFGIIAAQVSDLDGAHLAADVLINFSVANLANFDTYYEKVNLSSVQQLRCSLHETIKGHHKYPYSGAAPSAWTILEDAQEDPNNPGKIIDIYRNRSYTKVSDRAGTGSGDTYNREHTWPNSLGFANNNLAAYTDTHMLWLSDTAQNSSRGNKPLANCTQASGCSELQTVYNNGVGGGSGTYPGNSNWVKTPDGNAGSFEVWNHRKGELARAMFYMAIRYEGIAAEDSHDGDTPDLELTDTRSLIAITPNTAAKAYMGLLTDLLAWHQFDQPDLEEVDRNTVIQSYQNNRNPFVDHPEWASRALFESSQPATCVINQFAPAANDDNYSTAIGTPLTTTPTTGVLANDNDPEGAPMTAQLVANASHGSVTLGGNGAFTYNPTSGYCGSDSFTYKVSDGVRWSTTATASIAVGSSCGGTSYTVTATSTGNGTITPATQSVNAGGTATFTVTPAVGYHVASVSGSTCSVTGSGTSYSAANIQANCAVTASFVNDPIFADGFEE